MLLDIVYSTMILVLTLVMQVIVIIINLFMVFAPPWGEILSLEGAKSNKVSHFLVLKLSIELCFILLQICYGYILYIESLVFKCKKL